MTVPASNPNPTTTRRTGRISAALAVAVAMMLFAAGCSTGGDEVLVEVEPVGIDYSEFGPYAVGSRLADVDGVEVQLLYPVDRSETSNGTLISTVSSDVAFPDSLRDVLIEAAPFLVQELPVELYEGAPVAGDGPFPVVLYSHGFGGHPAYYLNNLAHTASWGYVVAAPNHPSRNLASTIAGGLPGGATSSDDAAGPATGSTDTDDLTATVTALDQLTADPDDPLHMAVDTSQLAAAGHSAGGSAAMRLAVAGQVAGRDLATVIGQAPAPPVSLQIVADPDATEQERQTAVSDALDDVAAPQIPVLLVAGERDGVIALSTVEATYEWLNAPRQLVVMANTGHNPVLDLCATIRQQGGLVAAAGGLVSVFGESVERLLALGEDGCVEGFTEPEVGFDVIRHLTVAQVRWALGQDADRASLDPTFLRDTFGEVIGPVETEL